MNKLITVIRSAIGALALSFFALIVFVSVLGENHRVDFLVEGFFKDLKDGNYSGLCPLIHTADNRPGTCMDRLFVLELAMLSRFGLLESSDYSLVITRDHFWIPFLTSGRVTVGVALTEKKKNMFEEWMSRFEARDRIEDFMTVERIDGKWEITGVRLEAPALASTMAEMERSVDLNRYIVKTEKGYAFKPREIDFKDFNPVEKRLFEFSLKKISSGGQDK
jgi:hypothetical protein